MNRIKAAAIAIVAIAIGATSAEAGCKFSQVAGKTFAMSATATGDATALHIDKYAYDSAHATLGIGFDWLALRDGQGWRFSLDLEGFHAHAVSEPLDRR